MMDILRVHLDRWNVWCQQSVNRRIFAAMMTVGSLTLVVHLAAIVKELVVAYQFGTSDALDAFLIAFLLPSSAMSIIAGSLNVAFIPTYVQVREHEGLKAAQQLFSNILVWSTILLFTLSALLALAASSIIPILGSGFSPEKLELTRSLFFVLLPLLVIRGLTNIWGAVLNAGERFALAAISPLIIHIATVMTLFWVGKTWGVYALAAGMVGGSTLEAGLLAWGLWRQRLALIPRWYGMNPATKKVLYQYAPMVAGSFLMSSTGFVDQSMAAMLGPGNVSVLNYGNKIVAFMLGAGSMALSTAVLPHFSQMVAIGDRSGVRHTLRTYVRLILMVTIPVTFISIYFSESLAELIFERGAFTETDTRLVGRVQSFYLLQVPFYILGILGVRLLSALTKNQILMVISGINLVANAVGNYVLMRFLGVAGISLSTSIVYAVSMSLIFLSLSKQLGKQGVP